MHEPIPKAKWRKMKGKIGQQWEKLTNEDIARLEGTQDELVVLLQARYGYESDQARREVRTWLERF